MVNDLRTVLSNGLSASVTASLHNSHDHLVKLHTLYELETISGVSSRKAPDRDVLFEDLNRRLDLLGAYTSDKQYLLGVRRAAMQLSSCVYPTKISAIADNVQSEIHEPGHCISLANYSPASSERGLLIGSFQFHYACYSAR